ncbi:MAG: protein phosphatase 2C domain-containing protein [Bacteroidales bacterium]|nr:protein phosphatase 2C domain-containing protein [Bacteroidales bacterium]
MKNKKIIKWTIITVLFLLSGLSVLCLNRQIKGQQAVKPSNDSINVVSQRDTIFKEIDKLVKLSEDLDSKFNADTKKIAEIDSIIKNNACSPDSIKGLIAEKKTLDSLTKIIPTTKDSINQCIDKLKDQYSSISKTTKSDTANTSFWSSLSIKTIILIVITFILVTAFIVSLILFSGILKLFKKKNKMEEINTPTTNMDSVEPENLKSNDKIEFVSPKPILTYSITLINNSTDCVIEIQSNLEDTEIYYCFSEDKKPILYSSPIKVSKKCLILAIGKLGDEKSEQIEISVDPYKEQQKQAKEEDTKISLPKVTSAGSTTTNVEDSTSDNKAQDGSKIDEIPSQPVVEESTKPQIDEKRVRKFTTLNNVIGISYQGDNHIKAAPVVPCQDCHSFTKVNDIWNIAIVSDGAGSKEHSDVGSDAVCAAFAFYLSNMLKADKRFANGDIPNERIWDLEFRALLTKFQNELKIHKAFKSYEFGSLAATIVILAYSPKGYLFAHVGDGRAGVKVNGEWKSILTPHKGEEANQTIFSTTIEFINKPTLMMSGVFVPETKVEHCNIEAFVLMSDGCEDGAWATYQKVNLPDGDFKVEDVNQPRPQTLEELMSILDRKVDEQKGLIIDFITGYNKGFKTEGDDKTILIGRIK